VGGLGLGYDSILDFLVFLHDIQSSKYMEDRDRQAVDSNSILSHVMQRACLSKQ
jgi:hypothetical protein